MEEKTRSQRLHLTQEATEAPAAMVSDEDGFPITSTHVCYSTQPLTWGPLPFPRLGQGPLSGCSPVVALGQLVGHWHERQSPVLLWAQRVVDPAPVNQAPFLALYEGLCKNLVLILLVQAERLQHSESRVSGSWGNSQHVGRSGAIADCPQRSN